MTHPYEYELNKSDILNECEMKRIYEIRTRVLVAESESDMLVSADARRAPATDK